MLEAALKESLTRDERITALRTIASAAFALGREPAARAAFERLLRIDPSHQLDRRQPPRLRVLLEETRTRLATQPSMPSAPSSNAPVLPTFSLSIPAAREGRPLTLALEGPDRDAPTLALFYRSGDARAFSRTEARRAGKGRYELTVPGTDVHSPRFEYYALLVDGGGAPSARCGSLGEPLSVAVATTPRPLYKKAWFWGTIGGVVVAGAVVAVLAVTLAPQQPASVTLQPH